MTVRRVSAGKLGSAIRDVIAGVENSTTQAIREITNDIPRKARNEALKFYPKVLNAPTGTLRRGIAGFTRTQGTDFYAGLKVIPGYRPKSKVNRATYGRFLHDGTKYIKARKFLWKPLKTTTTGVTKRLRQIIGFKR